MCVPPPSQCVGAVLKAHRQAAPPAMTTRVTVAPAEPASLAGTAAKVSTDIAENNYSIVVKKQRLLKSRGLEDGYDRFKTLQKDSHINTHLKRNRMVQVSAS